MSILDSLTSGKGSSTKWNFVEELVFVISQLDGTFNGTEFENEYGRSKAGHYAKRNGMLKYLKEQGCETRDDVIEAICKRHGKKVEDAEAVLGDEADEDVA